MAPSRFELKPLLEFLKQEFREKKPKGIDLILVKQWAILTRGPLPEFQMRAYPGSRHLVVEDLGPEHRVYFFAENGIMAGGANVPTNSPWLAKLWKGSRVLYHLPKKVPEVRPEQAAESEYQRFVKTYTHLASLWNARPEPPLLHIVSHPAYATTGLHLGAFQANDTRQVSLEALQSPDGPFILAREAFRLFVSDAACFQGGEEVEILANYLATIYCGDVCRGTFDRVWELLAITPFLARLPATLQQRPKQAVEKYLRGVASAIGLLGKIGEHLLPTEMVIFIKTLITDFLEERGGRNERILVYYYTDCLMTVCNAGETGQGAGQEGAGQEGAGQEGAGQEGAGQEGAGQEGAGQEGLSEIASKALLAHASYARDLKLGAPPDVLGSRGVAGSSLVNATKVLLAGKFQPILDDLARNKGQYTAPVQALARMAIAAQVRNGGVSIEVGKVAPLRVNQPAVIEVRLQNATDLLFYNADVTISPQPAGRVQVDDLQREGPIDLHTKLLFRSTITGVTTGAATLEVRASVDHPCPAEKRIILVTRVPITIG